jgi:hypothetical protein
LPISDGGYRTGQHGGSIEVLKESDRGRGLTDLLYQLVGECSATISDFRSMQDIGSKRSWERSDWLFLLPSS